GRYERVSYAARPLVPWDDADPAVDFGPAVAPPAQPAAPVRVDRCLSVLVHQLSVQAALPIGPDHLLVHRYDAGDNACQRGHQPFPALLCGRNGDPLLGNRWPN